MTLFRVRPADIRAGKYTIRALLDPPDHDRDSVLDKNALDSLPPPTIEEYVPYASLEYIEEDLWATPNLSDNDDKDSASESDEDEDDDVTAVDESQMPDLRDDGDEE